MAGRRRARAMFSHLYHRIPHAPEVINWTDCICAIVIACPPRVTASVPKKLAMLQHSPAIDPASDTWRSSCGHQTVITCSHHAVIMWASHVVITQRSGGHQRVASRDDSKWARPDRAISRGRSGSRAGDRISGGRSDLDLAPPSHAARMTGGRSDLVREIGSRAGDRISTWHRHHTQLE